MASRSQKRKLRILVEVDLGLLDHSSPTMDKVETETLEKITRYAPDLPVIMMSAR